MRVLEAIVSRRLLVNYRVDPAVARRHVPLPLEPLERRGAALAGIALVRLEKLRPRGLAPIVGLTVESMSHRFAVTAPGEDGQRQPGILVVRRDTESRLVALAGSLRGRQHGVARFEVLEDENRLQLTVRTETGTGDVAVDLRWGACFQPSASFASLEEARRFLEACESGLTEGVRGGVAGIVRVRAIPWQAEAVRLISASTSFFEDVEQFPKGSVELDGAIAMRSVPHAWVPVADVPEFLGTAPQLA